jgi:hypothetical protein
MSTPLDVLDEDSATILGKAAVIRYAYDGGDLSVLLNGLVARLDVDPSDAAALMDLSNVLWAAGQRDKARELQTAALALRRCYRPFRSAGKGPKLLAIVAPGDFMANLPIEFLLEGGDIDLSLFYVDAGLERLDGVPDHDVAFMAVGEAVDNIAILQRLPSLLRNWPRPVVNNLPGVVMALTRDGVSRLFANEPSILSPINVRVDRQHLGKIAQQDGELQGLLPGVMFPIIVRPTTTHAGQGMEKVERAADLNDYLLRHADELFYIAPFVDYGGPDGLFRKQRIVFIEGRAYPAHWATSDHWMVHYLSAEMGEHPERRAEEEVWMRDFDSAFAVRHAAAFEALHRQFGLDYFGIDCAEMPDGRLLLFEADVAMIVHDLDPSGTFPYKKPAMRRLFDAFAAMVKTKAASLATVGV